MHSINRKKNYKKNIFYILTALSIGMVNKLKLNPTDKPPFNIATFLAEMTTNRARQLVLIISQYQHSDKISGRSSAMNRYDKTPNV